MIEAVRSLVASGRLGAVVTVVSGPAVGAKGVIDYERGYIAGEMPGMVSVAVLERSMELMEVERSDTLAFGQRQVYVEVLAPKPHLVIFGAVHTAQPLSTMARLAGFEVTISDARAAFATRERFPDADRILVGRPDSHLDGLSLDHRTYVVILSHDPRFEDPVLQRVLGSPVRYIGAIGSTSTAQRRAARLSDQGFEAEQIARIHGPVGIDLGGRTAAETAVSILAELIRARYGGGRRPEAQS